MISAASSTVQATGHAIDIGLVDDSKLKKKLIADAVWGALDQDRNGTIEYKEFATRLPSQSQSGWSSSSFVPSARGNTGASSNYSLSSAAAKKRATVGARVTVSSGRDAQNNNNTNTTLDTKTTSINIKLQKATASSAARAAGAKAPL